MPSFKGLRFGSFRLVFSELKGYLNNDYNNKETAAYKNSHNRPLMWFYNKQSVLTSLGAFLHSGWLKILTHDKLQLNLELYTHSYIRAV